MDPFIEKNYWHYLVALLAGAALVLAFSPAHIFLISMLMPAILLWMLIRSSAKRAAALGFTFGLGFFGVGVSWVFVAIYVFGGTSEWLAVIITALFAMILAVFFAVLGYSLQKLFPHNTASKLLLIYPSLWALLEALRSWIFTGFPWLLLGHVVPNSFFAGLAPVFGVYGCSFYLVFMSSLILLATAPTILPQNHHSWKTPNLALLGLIVFFAIAAALQAIHWTTPQAKNYSVSLVQGNISQSLRWDPQEVENILQTYRHLTEEHWNSDIIVWPEAAIPLTQAEAKPYLDEVRQKLAQGNGSLITGMPIVEGIQYYNAVLGFGHAQGEYAKRHLVPFGEYVPFERWLRGVIKFFDLPMSSFLAGNMQQPLIKINNIPVGVFICYEIAYGRVLKQDLPQAQLLITVSDDAWFGNSLAPWQHLEIGQFQAAASGRPMLFVGNDGLTAIINHQGRVTKSIPQFIPEVLTGQVTPYTGSTPWIVMGDWPWLILMMVAIGISYFSQRKKR